MTEAEWESCADPRPMLDFLRTSRKTSDRKLRLFTVACWYRYPDLKKSEGGWAATEASERAAEELRGLTVRELKSARREAELAVGFIAGPRAISARRAERAVQASLLRCVVGNPFRPTVVVPRLSSAMVALVQAIYDEKSFDRMGALADDLKGAGCSDPDILGHLRGPGPHVRGCWVLDLVIGRT